MTALVELMKPTEHALADLCRLRPRSPLDVEPKRSAAF